MMARRMAGRGRCITSESITSVPRGSDSLSAVKVWVPWDEWPSVRFADGLSHAPRPPASVANQSGCPSGSPVHCFHWSLFMKPLALLAILALLAACAQSPTAPTTQSAVRQNLLVVPAGGVSAARNPSGTGQPGASCGSANAQTEPNGFGRPGFANAEGRYAGSEGTPSLANGSSKAVSQYDVACYQLSNK